MAKTYWHLQSERRVPRDYEVVSSRLVYHPRMGLAIETPVKRWYAEYLGDSRFVSPDWERFSDPLETTYTSYVERRHEHESFVDHLIISAGRDRRDRSFDPEWIAKLDGVFGPLRYPCHALLMCAAYVGQLAPASRITIAAMFQAADELRRIQGFARRLGQLQELRPELGLRARESWELDPIWQPMRELLETLLVTYDWGESFVALQLVVKPHFEDLLLAFRELGLVAGDHTLYELVGAYAEDARWHRAWSDALIRSTLVQGSQGSQSARAIGGWLESWSRRTEASVLAFAPVFESAHGSIPFERLVDGARGRAARAQVELGLGVEKPK